MGSKTSISTLRKILIYKKRLDLAKLLLESDSQIYESGTYGHHWNSSRSTFILFSPLESYYELRGLSNSDKKLLLDSVVEIFPPGPESPEIVDMEFRIKPTSEESTVEQTAPGFVGRHVRIFLSYSTLDKIIIGKIKAKLEDIGLKVFVAHDDIEGGHEWEKAIIENVKASDIFVPILTKNYFSSDWTNQESGIAIAENKLVIPLSFENITPVGFVKRFQTIKFKGSIEILCNQLILIIKKHPTYGQSLLESLINTLPRIASWDEAGDKLRLIAEFENLNENQINEVIEQSTKNSQIFSSWRAKPCLNKILALNKERINSEKLSLLEKSMTPV